MSEFKVGDRVIGIGTEDGAVIDGLTGTVKNVSLGYCTVDFEEEDFIGWGDSGRMWNVAKKRLKLLEPTITIKTKIPSDIKLEPYVSTIDIETLQNKEEKEMKLLKIYQERKLEQIDKNYEQMREAIVKDDEFMKKVEEFEKALKAEYKEIYEDITVSISAKTEDTQKKLDILRKERDDAKEELSKKYVEIEAQLDICETYEQKIDVLVSYGVLDKKTKVLTIGA